MKESGFIAIGPNGVIYRYSKESYGYFTWTLVKEIRIGGISGHKMYGTYFNCIMLPIYPGDRKKTHFIRFDNLTYDEIISKELLIELFKSYCKHFKGKEQRESELPKRIVLIENIFFVFMLLSMVIFCVFEIILYTIPPT